MAVNYLQKGCFNLPKHPIFTHALPWSSLNMAAKFQAARFHGFEVMDEMRARTLSHIRIDEILMVPVLLLFLWVLASLNVAF